ncbi:MogA/MoaB family molybdenum cofactor biosynthesis protein [Enterococcus sp. AZ109]|uniref:MogA/MoaB family molybdenum cofactor biosynthesis protein n=1 Tax=Enterococcus sp. AZ109 TaxID=2774634 RepID=UPI003F2834E3
MNLTIGIITVSDTRTTATDQSGNLIRSLAAEKQFTVIGPLIVKDDCQEIQTAYQTLCQQNVDVIITNGGTGIAKRDVTIEAIQPILKLEIPGFGEFFRSLSYQEIGTHAMASRTVAGFDHADHLLFALPGSTSACRLAMEQLILPEVYHLIKERRK